MPRRRVGRGSAPEDAGIGHAKDARSVEKPGDTSANATPGAGDPAVLADAGRSGERPPLGWGDLWQAPTLGVAAVLLAGGVVAAFLTAPKPDLNAPLARAAGLLEARDHSGALALLNERLLPHLGTEAFAPSRGEFHLLRARALSLGQRELGVSDPRNNANILSEYEAAAAHGAALEPQDEFHIADALVGQGKYDEAIERTRAAPPGSRTRRIEVLRRIVQRELATGPREPDEALRLLGEFAAVPGLSVDEQAWAEARQAELLLSQGHAEEVVRRLLRAMPRVDGASGPIRGELLLLLGTAYLDSAAVSGDLAALDRAERQLELALHHLPAGEALRGLALHRLGRVAEQTGDLAAAREHYAAVVRDFGEQPVVWPALLGLASVQAAGRGEANETEESLESFSRLVEHVRAEGESAEPGPGEVTDSLMARFQERLGEGDLELAIRFAELARDVSGLESAPSPVVKGLADANRRLAERLAEESGARGADRTDLRGVAPAAREAVRARFVAAGVYYRAHADRMVLEDNAAYADSLWLAGDSFDLGGDRDEAERAFREYANGFVDDPRRAEAAFRVAQALQARGDLPAAAEYYRALIREADDGATGGRAGGPFGDRSHVPLAQTLLSDNDAENDAEAIGLLKRVAGGLLGGPPSPGFREALLELGRVHYKRREFAQAIEWLSEAEAHSEGTEELAGVRFLLADAYRLSAQQIDRDLAQGRPEHEKRALRQLRAERLTRAAELFEKARAAMEGRGPENLTAVERVCLRNAYLYLGDCAFDLGDYAGAILRYDAARDRYPRDAASLVALVQIVNAYLQQGDAERARTANERARRFYESLPAHVWDDPDLPMTNDEWAAWLESSAKLSRLAGTGAGAARGDDP